MTEDLILKPSYLEKLKENMENYSSYEETFITKEQYDAYKKIEIEGIDFKSIVGKLGKNRTNDRYAKLRIRKHLNLSEQEYLRMINQELGYGYLPSTYKFSPIYLNIINGSIEEVGNLASLEIAKLLLFDEEGFNLIHEEPIDLNKSIIYKNIVTLGSNNSLMTYFGEIRMNSLNILLSKEYKIEEKLLLLEVFYSYLDLLNNKEKIDLVPEKIEELMTLFGTRNYEVLFKRLAKNPSLNLEILEYLIDLNMEIFKDDPYRKEMELNLNGFLERGDLKDLKTIYLENKKIYDDYMFEKEYILENYFVNEFFKNLTPYINQRKLKELHNDLAVDLIVLKLLLIGNSIYNGRLDKELISKKIMSYSRFKIENPNFLEMVKNYIASKGYDSIESLALILKN